MESNHISSMSDSRFNEEVLQSDKSILVDFWAEWCGPCRAIAPILEEVAKEYENKVSIMKMNVDENPETAPNYGVLGIPTLILFKNGEVKARHVGGLTKAQLKSFLDNNL